MLRGGSTDFELMQKGRWVQFIAMLAGLAVVAGVVWVWRSGGLGVESQDEKTADMLFLLSAEQLVGLGADAGGTGKVSAGKAGVAEGANGTETKAQATPQNKQPAEELSKTYADPKGRFTFRYPESFTVGMFGEGEEGDVVLAQDAEKKRGLQIYVLLFDEPGPITPKRIKRDLPDLAIEQPQNVVLKNGTSALAFLSMDSAFGRSQEVWFIFGGYLYQLSAPAPLSKTAARMIGTFDVR